MSSSPKPASVCDVRELAVAPVGALGTRLKQCLAELYGLRATRDREGAADVVLILPGGKAPDCWSGAPRVLDASGASIEIPDRRLGSIVLADDPGLPIGFRGRVIEDVNSGATPLAVADGERVMAQGAFGPLWVRRDRDSGFVDRVAVAPPDLEGAVLRDAFRPGRFIGMLPLLSLGQSLRASSTVTATIQIDDPNLHLPTYGYLDYPGIRRLAADVPIHVSIATIPLDAWYANPAAVTAFSGPDCPLSLCFHGNNHLRAELAKPVSDADGVAQLAQAVRRIEGLERRTHLRVSRVMAAPHGACSRETVRRLVRLGFEGLTLSNPRPWGATELDRQDILFGARRVEIVDGLPIVLRRHVTQLDDLPFAAFLEQSIIVYGHHWDWPGGADDLRATAERVNSVADVSWARLDGAVTRGTLVAREGSTVRIRLAGRAVELDVPEGTSAVIVEVERADTRDVLFVNGQRVDAGTLLPVSGRRIEAQLRADDAVNEQFVRIQRFPARAISRRVLTESRDRLEPLAGRVRGAVRGARDHGASSDGAPGEASGPDPTSDTASE